jgi:hypothetical protein
MSYQFTDSLQAESGWNCRSILILLASCQQTWMTYTITVCTVKNFWWWAEELSEICRVLFHELIWGISASGWFYCKKNENTDLDDYSNSCFITHSTQYIAFLFNSVQNYITPFSWSTGNRKGRESFITGRYANLFAAVLCISEKWPRVFE